MGKNAIVISDEVINHLYIDHLYGFRQSDI
jgi:hypothetical protein